MSEEPAFLIAYPGVLCTIVVMVLSCIQMISYSSFYSDQIKVEQTIQEAQVKLQREWRENGFLLDVFTVDATSSCGSQKPGAVPLFTYDWDGLRPLFYYDNGYGETVYTTSPDDGSPKNRRIYPLAQKGFPMIQGSNFGGKQICGLKTKTGFKDMSWDKFGGSCKSGFKQCPEGSYGSESYCVPSNDLGGKCPVTAMHFKKKNEPGQNKFEYVDFNQDYKIGFSRSANAMPLTEFQVSPRAPCLSPLTTPWDNDVFQATHYLNEHQYFEGATDYKFNCPKHVDGAGQSVYFDESRFNNLNKDVPDLKFTQLQFEKDNGINQVLQLQGAHYPDSRIESNKDMITLRFWTASALKPGQKITDSNKPSVIMQKLEQVQVVLSKTKETTARGQLQTRTILSFFTLLPFAGCSLAFLVSQKPLFLVLTPIMPIIFLYRSIRVWISVSSDIVNFNSSLKEKTELQDFLTKNVQPMKVFSEPVDLSFPGPQVSKFLKLEFFICLIVFLYFFAIWMIINRVLKEADTSISQLFLGKNDVHEPLVEDEDTQQQDDNEDSSGGIGLRKGMM